jgi:hypothetical protein
MAATRRTKLTMIGLSLAVALVASSLLGYRWFTSSRPVSAASAVQAYRSAHEEATLPSATAAPTPAPRLARSGSSHVASKPVISSPRAQAASPTAWFKVPPSGVYTFDTTGFERATFSRNYPSQTQRIIDTSNGSYENHHIFSQEHEEWFTLHPTAHGGEMLKRRMRVTFGPVTVDETVTFDPGIVGVPYPYALGRTWSGSWKGETSGTYTGRTIDHRTIRIGSDNVEVWVEELKLQMSGKNSGTVDTKLWYAPAYGFDAREDGIYDIRTQGVPGTYHTEYTITLASTHPQR